MFMNVLPPLTGTHLHKVDGNFHLGIRKPRLRPGKSFDRDTRHLTQPAPSRTPLGRWTGRGSSSITHEVSTPIFGIHPRFSGSAPSPHPPFWALIFPPSSCPGAPASLLPENCPQRCSPLPPPLPIRSDQSLVLSSCALLQVKLTPFSLQTQWLEEAQAEMGIHWREF